LVKYFFNIFHSLVSNPIIGNQGIKYLEKILLQSTLKTLPKYDKIIVLSGYLHPTTTFDKKIKYEFNDAVDRVEMAKNLIILIRQIILFLTKGKLPWQVGLPRENFCVISL
jgi:hypothetical protein